VLITWRRGREIVTRNRRSLEGSLGEFVEELHGADPPINRIPGTAVFLTSNPDAAPLAMRANVEHSHALKESVVVASISTEPVPHVPEKDRLEVDDLGFADDGITHLAIRFGFADEPDVPEALRLAEASGAECVVDVDSATYFISRISIVETGAPGMRRWRKKLFLWTAGLATDPSDYFGLPHEQTVVFGSHVEV
jgi:KUP system potassium uptake protein